MWVIIFSILFINSISWFRVRDRKWEEVRAGRGGMGSKIKGESMVLISKDVVLVVVVCSSIYAD